ncbi:hypothetical protein BD410DRAFT_329050 [Rickenella mellea]|uniref:Uncharacterized protein n=1 Tax=Rickenella mellea TaxID=50990 RepID=A0A4Y7QK79_9AGAM|nr:hypothetical protein BD410DRAFT_329050 [Rickenella mellea]
MTRPSLEIVKFSIYLFIPLGVMVHYAKPEWYMKNVLPVGHNFASKHWNYCQHYALYLRNAWGHGREEFKKKSGAHFFPVEIWKTIYTFACAADVPTGNSLRLSCRTLSEIVRPYQWQALVLKSSEEMLRFASSLKNPDNLCGHRRPIYHLYCSTISTCFIADGRTQQESFRTILEYAAPTLETLTCDERVALPFRDDSDFRISAKLFQVPLTKLTELSLHASGSFSRKGAGNDNGMCWPATAEDNKVTSIVQVENFSIDCYTTE